MDQLFFSLLIRKEYISTQEDMTLKLKLENLCLVLNKREANI